MGAGAALILVLGLGLFAGSAAAGEVLAETEAEERPLWDYSIEDLMAIKVVTPSKTEESLREAPAIASVVTWREIEAYGANTLFDVLDRVAGLYIYGSYYLPNNMITIRGDATSSYCTHVLLLIDGRPYHSSKEGYDLPFLNGFPLDVIDRIEVIRGPGSTLYGTTAYAGAINVITRRPGEQPSVASVSAGSFGTRSSRLATGFRKGDFGFTMGAQLRNEEGWERRVRDGDRVGGIDTLFPEFTGPAPQRSFGVHSSLSWRKLRLSGFAGQDYLMNGYQLQYVVGWPELNLGTTHAVLDLGYSLDPADWLRLHLNATWNYQHYWQPFDINANDDREYSYSNDGLVEAAVHMSPLPPLRVTMGGLVSYNTGYIHNNQQLADGRPYDVWANPPNPDPYQVVPEYSEAFVSGYVNAAWTAWERFKIIAGAHANKAPDLDLDVVPRVGLIAGLSRHLTWKILYGEAFRSPDVFERFSKIGAIVGDPHLKPERIATAESQLAYVRKSSSVALSAYRSLQTNLINRANADDTIFVHGSPIRVEQIFVNEGEIESRGLELEGTIQATRHWAMSGSLTWQENETREGVPDLFGVPNVFAKLGLTYARPAFSMGLHASHYDYLDEVAGYSVPFPGANPPAESFTYVTWHSRASWNALLDLRAGTPGFTTEIYLVNLLDETIYYPEHGRRFVNSTPGRPGFAAYAGVRLDL